MVIRLIGALIRATLGALIWLAPSLVLPNAGSDAVILTALLVFLFIFYEYAAKTPSLIEFRFAYGFNLFRFALLALLVAAVCLICLNEPRVVSLSETLANWLDFAGSPVRFMTVLVGDVAPEASLVLTITLIACAILCLAMTMLPIFKRHRFNLWKNLPNAARSAIAMNRTGWMNLLFGVALLYFIPLILSILNVTPHTHAGVWGVILWAFTPAMLILRGTALLKISRGFA